MLRFASREIAADYTREFEQMFGGSFGTSKRSASPYEQAYVGPTRAAVFFSPEDGVAQHVLRRLSAAKSSIRFLAFSFTQRRSRR